MPISLLPMRVLYVVSDILFFVVYHLIGYRRKVVLSNLKRSFPERSNEEIRIIENRFYHHFCDIIMESVKAFTITAKQINKMVDYENLEIFDEDYARDRSCVSYSGHYGNWELPSMSLPMHTPYIAKGLMAKLKNRFFNEKIQESRSRFGSHPLFLRDMQTAFDDEGPVNCVFFADQNPSQPKNAHWTEFLHQDTGFYTGAEKIAKENNLPIYLMISDKIKRGKYLVRSKKLIDNPASYSEGEITEIYVRELEKLILEKPHIWLWTHRRWKHSRPVSKKQQVTTEG